MEKLFAIFWVCLAVVLVTAITGGYFYNSHKNELILKADSCEKALIIDGFQSSQSGHMILCLQSPRGSHEPS